MISTPRIKNAEILTHPFCTMKMFMTQVLEAEVVAHVYPFWNISVFKNSHEDFC